MRLFQRTLWSFVAVIGLQAALTGAAIAALVGSMQAEDAARELGNESHNAFESFNAWKLAFWKTINDLAEDRRLERAVLRASASPSDDAAVVDRLRSRLAGSGAEAALLKDEARGISRLLIFDPRDPAAPDPDRLNYRKPHPYIEIVSARSGFWFAGVVRIAPAGRTPLDLFLLKHIDVQLVNQLSYDPMVAVVIYDSLREIAGHYSGAGANPKAETRASVNAEEFLRFARAHPPENASTLYPYRAGPRGTYGAMILSSGAASTELGEDSIRILTTLSMAEYGTRVARINGAVVAVSLLVAVLTVLLALGLARSITSPIRGLAAAMHLVGEGDYDAKVTGPRTGEIGELVAGFNGMARKLAVDKGELQAYIAEIVGLKEYGDGIINAIREGLAVISEDGIVESVNRAFLDLFGLAEPQAVGAALLDITRGPFDEELLGRAKSAMRERESEQGVVRRTGEGRSFELKLYPLGPGTPAAPEKGRCIVVVEDVSERLAYEERVIRAEKLASIGMLSAGVAHEVNNPLSSILSNVQNLIEESREGGTVEVLRLVERETFRIARIVRQLLDFSATRFPAAGAGGKGERPRCDPNDVVRELVLLVGYPFRKDSRIRLSARVDPACPGAAITEDELKQILLNLIKNALHAIGDEGTIIVRTEAAPGGALLSVSDSGPGIPESIIGRIFDPFFTTKSPDGEKSWAEGRAGIGLGLSVAYGIVTTRGGSIRAENGPEAQGEGRGAILRVFVPAAE